ncbi:unnamed protein product [Symbiodinium sp. CCMP2592]|nr:unnamed protein product [Symbiodinium sp. CCMP2592]
MDLESWGLPSLGDPLLALDDGPLRPEPPANASTQQPGMLQLLTQFQIPVELHPSFLEFSPTDFGLIAISLESLEGFLDELVYPAEPSELLSKSRIRRLWRQCHALTDPKVSQVSVAPAPSQVPLHSDSGWVESFPKKLTAEAVKSMVAKFKSRYPSETLSPDSMPSSRLLALTAKQLQDRRWKYIPWKWRLSEEAQESAGMARPSKLPRLESALFDQVPERELTISTMGKSLVQELLMLQATALALYGGAHLHTLKEMVRIFMARLYERYPADSMLRSPSVAEAQTADQKLWQSISSLYNEQQWTLDQAVHEVVVIRNEIHYLLMPRPARQASHPTGNGRGSGRGGKGETKGNGKGRKGEKGDKGRSDRQQHANGFQVAGLKVGLFYMAGQSRRNLCRISSWGGALGARTAALSTGEGQLAVVETSCAAGVGQSVPGSAILSPVLPAGGPSVDVAQHEISPQGAADLATSQALVPQLFSSARTNTSVQPTDLESVVSSCLQLLQSAQWPESPHARPAVTDHLHTNSGYWNFGVRISDKSSLTNVTQQLRSVVIELNALLRQLWPTDTWNTICISHNCFSAPHRDLANIPGSKNLVLSLGSFSDGQLWLEDVEGNTPRFVPDLSRSVPGRLVDVHNKPFSFDPGLWHGSSDWVGDRWVIIAYSIPEVSCEVLRDLGFPMVPPVPVPSCTTPQQQVAHDAPATLASSVPPSVPLRNQPRFFLDLFAGAGAPLSMMASRHGLPCIAVDILRRSADDLLDDKVFDALLKLAYSGVIAFAHASPPCGDYSIVKRFDGGPPPCRSWDFLQGLPSNDEAAHARVKFSHLLLSRAIMILHAVFQSGNHVSLEQPRNSMAWAEPIPITQAWMLDIAADIIQVAACNFGSEFEKYWVFATSWHPLQELQGSCPHPRGTHRPFHGVRDSSGEYTTRKTAAFPEKLCQTFISAIAPLFPAASTSAPAPLVSIDQATQQLPIRPVDDLPTGQQDGGGIYSQPDWTSPPAGYKDVFRQLRRDMWDFFKQQGMFDRLRKHVSTSANEPIFTPHEVATLRSIWESWFRAQGFTETVSWAIAQDQPYALEALALLSKALGDRDTALWHDLQCGVPTGIAGDISLSNCFLPMPADFDPDSHDVQVCSGNWPGANEEPELLDQLVTKEVEKGYVTVFDSLESAKAKWDRVAVGKVNVVKSFSRDPRLIVDPTVSGVNPSCHLPERFLLPGLGDIRAVYPLRGVSGCTACSLDIQAAHKTVRIRESEQGLLGFCVKGKYYFYKVAPFGGSFSALWWQRVAGFYIRTGHRLIFISHILLMYVDDALLLQHSAAIELSALLMLAMSQSFGYPISWRKLQLGARIEYVGWRLNFRAGNFSLPDAKVAKLLQALTKVLQHDPCSKRDLQALIGLLHWVMQMSPELLPWLCCLYHDLVRPLGTNFSLNTSAWQQLPNLLDEDMRFNRSPPGTHIAPGCKLLSARHVETACKADLQKVRVTGRRIWVRVSDPSSSKRRISPVSRQFILFWVHFCMRPQVPRCLSLPPLDFQYSLAADACAKGCDIGIGGWVSLPNQPIVWFAEWFTVSQFLDMGLPMKEDANLDITAYETLAQLALLVAFTSITPAGRLRVCIGTESLTNKLFTVHSPLCFFTQKLATWSWQSGIALDCSHIAGCHNDKADFLSRWQGDAADLPSDFHVEHRIRCPLSVLWEGEKDVRVFPPDASFMWQPPLPCLK